MKRNKGYDVFAVWSLLMLLPFLLSAETLAVPAMEAGVPAPGKRVRVTPPEYAGTDVHHSLYLPSDWKKGGVYPVIVEYTGNYFPASGSTGKVQDANLGYGLSAGKFIWVVLPFVKKGGKENEISWWGDEAATAAYCKVNVPRICKEFGGDPSRVFLCGFSRGAIGVNYIGLQDDEIAKLWKGIISHDHYDGELEWRGTPWGSPLSVYRAAASNRLQRLKSRPVLVMQNASTSNIRQYLGGMTNLAAFTFLDVPIRSVFPMIPNEHVKSSHTDKWPLFENPATTVARGWLAGQAQALDRNRKGETHE